MVPRRSARRPAPAPQRRRLVWTRSIQSDNAAHRGGHDLLEDFRATTQYGAQPLGTTITRVRGVLTVVRSAATPTGITWGLVVEDRNSLVTELPKPTEDPHVDWMAWQPVPMVGPSGITGDSVSAPIDIRSQRRLDEVGQTLWLSWDESVVSPTITFSVTFILSVLLRLP